VHMRQVVREAAADLLAEDAATWLKARGK